jgi:hypothetical protein
METVGVYVGRGRTAEPYKRPAVSLRWRPGAASLGDLGNHRTALCGALAPALCGAVNPERRAHDSCSVLRSQTRRGCGAVGSARGGREQRNRAGDRAAGWPCRRQRLLSLGTAARPSPSLCEIHTVRGGGILQGDVRVSAWKRLAQLEHDIEQSAQLVAVVNQLIERAAQGRLLIVTGAPAPPCRIDCLRVADCVHMYCSVSL